MEKQKILFIIIQLDAELIQMIWNKDMNNDDSDDRDDNLVDTLIDQNEEETDNDKIDNDVKEMLLSDINYNNNYDQKMPNFYREHRYDIKKPGPRFLEEYFFKPDNTDNNDVDQSIISAAISTNNDDNVDDDDEIMDEKKKNDGKTWHGTEPMLIKVIFDSFLNVKIRNKFYCFRNKKKNRKAQTMKK